MENEIQLKFSGLSTPEDLIDMWKQLKQDKDPKDMNVIWDYQYPYQLKNGFNIVNILYDPKNPNETGHYVLITVDDDSRTIEYYNPVGKRTADDIDKLLELQKHFAKWGFDVSVDLSGKQTETSENCGYHCLTHAYNLYISKIKGNKENNEQKETKGGEIGEGGASITGSDGTLEDKIDQIIKLLRGIYYGNKYGYENLLPKKNDKKKGKGLADIPRFQKQYFYKDLKKDVEKYGPF